MLVVVLLAGGGTPVWARALVLLVAGGWVLMYPPTETPSRWFELAVLGIFVTALWASFAPSSWMGHLAWRKNLAGYGVTLPGVNATAPWLAAEAVAQLVAGVVWLYACWNSRLTHESRKLALWALAALGSVLSAGAALGNVFKQKYPLAVEAMNFSFFPNRNESALWYSLSGIVAFGLLIEGLHRRRPRFMLAGVMLGPCVLALVVGRSRMAMALFALGTVAVLLVRLGRKSGKYIMGVLIPLAVMGVVLLIFFGDNDTLQRLPGLGGAAGTSPEFRLKLWRDSFAMTKAQPAGVGLDQFAEVFPQYRRQALTFQAVRHPDSDWVWLMGETGWLGLAAGLLAAGALAAVLLGKDARSSGPYRSLATICLGLYLMDSIVNVPTHRFGTWLLAPWLLAIAAPDQEKIAKSWFPKLVWRMTGLALVAVGGLWLAAQAGLPLNSTLIEQRAHARSDAAVAQKDGDALLNAATDGVKVRPLAWWPYFQRARAELVYQNNPDAALNDFRIARFLEPTWARVPYTEGMLWEPTNHVQALVAWREALQRQDDVPEGLWRTIFDELHTWPDGEENASILSRASPLFRWEFLTKQVSDKGFSTELANELGIDPQLARFTEVQRREILVRWAQLDGKATLAFLSKNPKVVEESWMISMAALAASGQKGAALKVAREHYPDMEVPKLTLYGPSDPASLKQRVKDDPKDLEAGVALLRSELDDKDDAAALATLELLTKDPNPPPFVSWWRAELLVRVNKMDEAWDAFQPYLQYEQQLAAKGK
jgi:hypothetical protein